MNFFAKKIGPIKLWWVVAIGLVSLILIIIGSFLDLNISKSIANQDNIFAKIIESYGTILACTVAPIGCSLLTKKIFVKGMDKRLIALGVFLVIAATVGPAFFASDYASGQPGYSWKYNKWIAFSWLIVFYLAFYFGSLFLIDADTDIKVLIRNGLYIVVGFVLAMIFINLILKGLIYRPRYRALAWVNSSEGTQPLGFEYYRGWWTFAFWQKPDWFKQMNLPSDYIKSWPSGHTATATCLLMLPFATSVYKRRSNIINASIFVIATVQIVVVAFGRIIAGAHFLSDVSSAVLLSVIIIFLPILLINYILNRIFKENVSQL